MNMFPISSTALLIVAIVLLIVTLRLSYERVVLSRKLILNHNWLEMVGPFIKIIQVGNTPYILHTVPRGPNAGKVFWMNGFGEYVATINLDEAEDRIIKLHKEHLDDLDSLGM